MYFSWESPLVVRRKPWVIAPAPHELGVRSHACIPVLEKRMHEGQESKAILETSLGVREEEESGDGNYLGAPGWGQWSQGPCERQGEGRGMLIEIKSEEVSIAGFGHEGSSYQGTQVASKSLREG